MKICNQVQGNSKIYKPSQPSEFAAEFQGFATPSHLKMLFLANEPAKKAEINILTARDTTGPGF